MPPSEEERGEKEIALPERRSGKAPTNEPLEEMSTRTLQSRDKNHGKRLKGYLFIVLFYIFDAFS